MPNQVLLIRSDDESVPEIERDLLAAGHQVHTCHRPGHSPFPCNGLVAEASCPLETADIDVAIDVRLHPWPRPTPLEDGVTCALRHRVPLVVAGRTALHPFQAWATVTIDGTSNIAAACEQAIDEHLGRQRTAAVTAVREVLDHAGLTDVEVCATVTRHRGRLHVFLDADLPVGRLRTMAAARVGAALRSVDPEADAMEISFRPADEPRTSYLPASSGAP